MIRYARKWIAFSLLTVLSLTPWAGYATSASQVYTVNPNIPTSPTNFHTIQDAIDTFQGTEAEYLEIDISPGTYVENIQIEQGSATQNLESRNYDLQETSPNGTILRGLQINGDMRPCFPQYQNGYELAASSTQSATYTLTTSVAGVGPYPVLISNGFGAQPTSTTGPLGVQVCSPYTADPLPLSNSFGGDWAIVGRGAIGFATKATRVQAAGAGGMILVDNSSVGTVQMGGSDPTVTIPCFSISNTFGGELQTALGTHPDMTITVAPPATFYNPPIGSNFGVVTLSHPGGDYTKIQVTISNPLPAVDPFLSQNVTPVLEQPVFDDPRLALVAGDQIILSESDIFGNNGRQVYTVASLSGNVITLTTAVDPSVVDITKLGSSLTFLPNVIIQPAEGRLPVFRAQEIGFSMSGIWIDTNPAVGFAQTSTALVFGGVKAFLSNVIVTDTNYTSANGFAFDFGSGTDVAILDGWRDSDRNRRLSSIGWSHGFNLVDNSTLNTGGGIVFATNAIGSAAGNLLAISEASSATLGSVVLSGSTGLLQPGSIGVNIGPYSNLTSNYLLTVTDVFGGGISGSVTCDSFRLERVYKPSGDSLDANAIQIGTQATFEVTPIRRYADTDEPIYLIRGSSIISDCYDIDPNGDVSSGTIPNVGIFVDDEGLFVSHKDLVFNNNSVDYLTVEDNQFITPGWGLTPGNIFPITESGELNSVYQIQEIKGRKVHLTLDPSELFQYRGIYINSYSRGKTFHIVSDNASEHTLKLKHGHFLGTKHKTLKFKPHKGASVTLKILSPDVVEVVSRNKVRLVH